MHLKADGFKELDGGGNTGFDKSDLMTKFNYRLNGDNYTQLHEDQIERNHIENNFFVRSGNLQSTGEGTRPTSTNTENTEALSVYIQDTLQFKDLSVTVGVRGESIDSYYQNRTQGREQDFLKKTNRIWLPSVSAYCVFGPTLSMFDVFGANIFVFVFNVLGANLRHSHVWWSWGDRIESWFISPAQHQVHHSDRAEHFDHNLGSTLAIWDRMIGTLIRSSKVSKIRFGIGAGDPGHQSIYQAYTKPFKDNLARITSIKMNKTP